MTYLEIVNNVLKRLREREVSTVNENAYSGMIGILVNDAKTEVENTWKWSALRTTMTITTSANNFSYTLTGTQNNFDTLNVLNDTDDWFLEYKPAQEMDKLFLGTPTTETGSPQYYSFNGVNSSGDTQIDLYPIPDGVYTIRYNMVKRSADLSADTDTVSVPAMPIIMLAYAKAVEERGEDAGIASSSAYAVAQKHLSDYISLDGAKHPEELEWYTV